MRTLYQQQHALSNDFGSIRAKNTGEFRGAVRGVTMSRIFCDLPKFSLIYYVVAQTSLICDNLHHTCKKDLTRDPVAGILAPGSFSTSSSYYYWRRRLLRFDLIAPNVEKRLDNLSFCTYTGAGTTFAFSLSFRTGAPAPKISKNQAISRNNWCRVSRGTFARSKIIPEIIERGSPDRYICDDRINEIS